MCINLYLLWQSACSCRKHAFQLSPQLPFTITMPAKTMKKYVFFLTLTLPVAFTYECSDATNVITSSATLPLMSESLIRWIQLSNIMVSLLLLLLQYLILAHIYGIFTLECLADGYFSCHCGDFKDCNPDQLRSHVHLSCPLNNDPLLSTVHLSSINNSVDNWHLLINCVTQDNEGNSQDFDQLKTHPYDTAVNDVNSMPYLCWYSCIWWLWIIYQDVEMDVAAP